MRTTLIDNIDNGDDADRQIRSTPSAGRKPVPHTPRPSHASCTSAYGARNADAALGHVVDGVVLALARDTTMPSADRADRRLMVSARVRQPNMALRRAAAMRPRTMNRSPRTQSEPKEGGTCSSTKPLRQTISPLMLTRNVYCRHGESAHADASGRPAASAHDAHPAVSTRTPRRPGRR